MKKKIIDGGVVCVTSKVIQNLTWAYCWPSSLKTNSRFIPSFSFLPRRRFLPPFPLFFGILHRKVGHRLFFPCKTFKRQNSAALLSCLLWEQAQDARRNLLEPAQHVLILWSSYVGWFLMKLSLCSRPRFSRRSSASQRRWDAAVEEGFLPSLPRAPVKTIWNKGKRIHISNCNWVLYILR